MKNINLSLTNFNELKDSLNAIKPFVEVKYNYFINEESGDYSRKISLEQGLEVIIFELTSSKEFNIIQKESKEGYFSKYFILDERLESNPKNKENIVFNSHLKKTICFCDANAPIKGIIFIFNRRWLETKFSQKTVEVFMEKLTSDKIVIEKNHDLKFKFEKISKSIKVYESNSFTIKLKFYVLFQYCIEGVLSLELD